jgi:RecA-family ATPase
MTGPEFAEKAPSEVPWVVRGFLAAKNITLLLGIPKVGKTSLAFAIIRAILHNEPFLMRSVLQGPVVLLTEQLETSLRERLAKSGILDDARLIILQYDSTRGVSFPDVMQRTVETCHEVGAGVLVIDTFSRWVGLQGDSENNSGAVLEAMDPIRAAAADGLAVLIIHHERKSGGSAAVAGRGSSAIAGEVDIVLKLAANGGGASSQRVIEASSRFDETPASITIERLESGDYIEVSGGNVTASDRIREILSRRSRLTSRDMERELELSPSTINDSLNKLVATGTVLRSGSGVKGDAFLYSMAGGPSDCPSMEQGPRIAVDG